uniref:CSON015164 protein n=1 Tax=Culicoides sonorensis TaxID=179676 RepID=A0A336MGZ7_CULSO
MPSDQTVHPQVLWAQDKKQLFLTVNVECKDPEIKWTDQSLYFKGVGSPENKTYEVTVNFLNKIVPEKVVSKNITRCIEFTVPKQEESSGFWPKLTTDKGKLAWLKVDFNKWKDEDDDGDDEEMGGMGDFGNMDDMLKNLSGGPGGDGSAKPAFQDSDDEEEDSDEDIPPVE